MVEKGTRPHILVEKLRERGYLSHVRPDVPGRGILKTSSIYPEGKPTVEDLKTEGRAMAEENGIPYVFVDLDHPQEDLDANRVNFATIASEVMESTLH